MAVFLAFVSGFVVGLFLFFAIGGLIATPHNRELERRRMQAQAEADAAWVLGMGRPSAVYPRNQAKYPRNQAKVDFDAAANRNAGADYRE